MKEESKSATIETKQGAEEKEEDPKSRFKITLMRLITQMKQGCKKDICFNKYC